MTPAQSVELARLEQELGWEAFAPHGLQLIQSLAAELETMLPAELHGAHEPERDPEASRDLRLALLRHIGAVSKVRREDDLEVSASRIAVCALPPYPAPEDMIDFVGFAATIASTVSDQSPLIDIWLERVRSSLESRRTTRPT